MHMDFAVIACIHLPCHFLPLVLQPKNNLWQQNDRKFPFLLPKLCHFVRFQQQFFVLSQLHLIKMNNKVYFSAENSMPQIFSIPKPLIRYICINPSPSPSLLYKLYFSCKFFYPKIKIIAISYMVFENPSEGPFRRSENTCLAISCSKWLPLKNKDRIFLPSKTIYKIDFKFCCVDTIFHIISPVDPHFASYLLTKFWYFKGCSFQIYNQILSIEEYEILAAGSSYLCMPDITVLDTEGKALPCEELVRLSPNVTTFFFVSREKKSYFTSQTSEALSKIKRTVKFKSFSLVYIQYLIDPLLFSIFIKNNMEKESRVYVKFDYETTTTDQLNTFEKTLKSFFTAKEFSKIDITVY